jgi:hypothetical protein
MGLMFPVAADTCMIYWLCAAVVRIQSCCCNKRAQSFVCKHMRTATYVEFLPKLLQDTHHHHRHHHHHYNHNPCF